QEFLEELDALVIAHVHVPRHALLFRDLRGWQKPFRYCDARGLATRAAAARTREQGKRACRETDRERIVAQQTGDAAALARLLGVELRRARPAILPFLDGLPLIRSRVAAPAVLLHPLLHVAVLLKDTVCKGRARDRSGCRSGSAESGLWRSRRAARDVQTDAVRLTVRDRDHAQSDV